MTLSKIMQENKRLQMEKEVMAKESVDMVMRVKKDDMNMIERMRDENDYLEDRLIRMQQMLEQTQMREEYYKKVSNSGTGGGGCNVM